MIVYNYNNLGADQQDQQEVKLSLVYSRPTASQETISVAKIIAISFHFHSASPAVFAKLESKHIEVKTIFRGYGMSLVT